MIPICIQTIENDDDRDFMEWLFLEYHPLMYATIRKVIHDQWTCEDVLQESVRKFIDHIPQLRRWTQPPAPTTSLWRAGIMPSRRKSVSAEPPSLWGMG